jgi:tRNA U54 and U55 pseudouridine synthase Pus10
LGIDAEGTEFVKQLTGDGFRIFPSFSEFLHSVAATNRRHWIG